MPSTSSPWPLLSDVLEGKIPCTEFSVTDKEISFFLANETIRILFTNLNLESLEGLVRYYQDNPGISHSHGTNHAEHCASYVTSIIAHATQEQWGEFDLMNKWRTSNQEEYAKCGSVPKELIAH